MRIYKNFKESNNVTLYNGDCRKLLKRLPSESVDLVVTSPPYCIGKAYEDPHDDIETFRKQHQDIFSDLYRVVKPGGSICWQIGYHVSDKCVVPLDYIVYDIFTSMSEGLDNPLILRNRIVWTFGHGLNSTTRFSGRHEMILWFTKGLQTVFNLDEVRVPQKYPGKRFYKGPNKGQLSGNPMGKNPSDVWDIPNVKAKHIEKTAHPCQFPVAIPRRLIRALTNKNGLVLDPFMGSGTTGVAALIEGRRFVGSEIQKSYETYCDNEKLSPLVREIPWTSNLLIMTGCKTDEAREFYLRLCIANRYTKRELDRQIGSMLYERTMISHEKHKDLLVGNGGLAALRDSYVFEFLDLEEPYKEKDLRRQIVSHLKDFILEFGHDFTFVGEEYRVQVGNTDFFIDLLFYNRALSCLVAIELKIDTFRPEHLGQLNFYLEALDRDVKKPNENPSVGLVLCTGKDDTVVEYALSRSMSPTMVADYTLHLPDKAILQSKLRELTELALESGEGNEGDEE